MPKIELETLVNADIEICFDLSRSIDLHTISTSRTNEVAVSGVTSGLISLNETVTWEATHFFVRQKLTSKITSLERPFHFRDEQTKGAFKYIKHDHYFEKTKNGCLMKDIFDFQSPLGIIGIVVDELIMTRYLANFLTERNSVIKEYAETGKWEKLLSR